MLVCFNLNYFKEPEPDIDPTEHHVDWSKGEETVMARSLDGGESWNLERPEAFAASQKGKEPGLCPGGIDFTNPNFAMRMRSDIFHVTGDRGKTWQGPYLIPLFGVKLGGRTDYIVDGKDVCTLMISAAKGPLCARTTDGGKTFKVLSNMAPATKVRAIMPSTVRVSETELISAVRQLRGEAYVSWIDVYGSADNGRRWKFLSKVADADNKYWNGNPPSMVKLGDGRICVTYGYRAVPYGIRAKSAVVTARRGAVRLSFVRTDGTGTWAIAVLCRGRTANLSPYTTFPPRKTRSSA
jgi:hypothetical protein